jgi:hypothetical protein
MHWCRVERSMLSDPKLKAHGSNRADDTFIPRGPDSGPVMIEPDVQLMPAKRAGQNSHRSTTIPHW